MRAKSVKPTPLEAPKIKTAALPLILLYLLIPI